VTQYSQQDSAAESQLCSCLCSLTFKSDIAQTHYETLQVLNVDIHTTVGLYQMLTVHNTAHGNR